MNNDNLLGEIKKIIKPLEEGQKRLEKNYKELLEGQNELQQNVKEQGKDIKILKQDVKNVDLKIEIVNNNLKKTEKDIITHITYLFENSATQKQVDELEHQVKILKSA